VLSTNAKSLKSGAIVVLAKASEWSIIPFTRKQAGTGLVFRCLCSGLRSGSNVLFV